MSNEKQIALTGSSKGGKKQRAPIDHAATLFSRATAQLIDLLCEGEIFGLLDRSFPAKSIFFDEVRVQNEDESFNFEGVTIQEKVGTPSQSAVLGFDEVESSVSVNQEITDIASPQFTITETSIDAIRVIIQLPSLMIQDTSTGDLNPHTVGVKIEVSENHADGAFTEILTDTITGKTKSPYQRAYRVDLSPYTTDSPSDYPLIFKVSRTTPESETTTTQDQIFLDSYVEIQEQKFEYPDSAYVAITVDSELFGGKIPKRSYEIKGLKIQHPANYDPDTRVYTGIWDGTFLEGYCNNPAWVMYDMLTNSRYGLGDDIDASQVDKAALYQIGIYCDELVDDGKGGQEPRFTINAVMTQRKEAYTVLNAIASVFRGMAFWSAGGVSFSNDQPKDPVRVVTNASVKDGDFTYSGVGLKARHSAVLVTWNDPLDFYRQQIEVVEDPDLIQRFGWRQIELVAFGTTSRAQAIRMGKWLLQAEATETETVTYEAGWDHADTTPGQIIQISDEHRVGARVAGRILGKDLHSLTTSIPTDALAIESTFTSVTTYVDTGVESDADAVFKCTLKIPSAIVPEGVIFEVGDSTTGAYVGFNSDGDLIFRAGDASATPPAATTSARIVIPYASLAKDQDLDILWDYRISPGRIRVWINNQYVAEQCTSAGADLLGSVWASTGGGGYGTLSGTTVVGESGNFTQNVQDSGVLLKSTLQYWRDTDVFTPCQPHTIKESFSDGDTITSVTDTTAGGMDRDTNAVISCAIKTPAAGTTPEGLIVELGQGTADADEAFYLGFDGTGDLVVHAGAGGDNPDTAEAARIVVPAAEWTADTWYHLTVQILPATGEIGLWINHTFREWAQTTDFGPFQDGRWADTSSGGYGLAGTTLSVSDLTGDFNLAFNGTLTSTLDYYRDVELTDAQNAFGAGTLTLDQEWVVEPGDRIVVVVADNAPNIVSLVPGSSGAEVTLRGRTRKDVALNAVFFIQGAVTAQEWTVLNNREADTHQYQITALRYDRTKFDRVEQGIVIEPERISLLPTGTLLPPTNLTMDESLYLANGNVLTRVNLSWSPAKDARVMFYMVEVQLPSGTREQLQPSAVPNITIQAAEEGLYSFWVTSLSDATSAIHQVSTAALLNQTVFGKTIKPGKVENFTAVRGFVTVTLSWDQATDIDLLGYNIKEGQSWEEATSIVERFAGTKYIVDVDTTDEMTYLIKAIDTTGNESEFSTSVTTSVQVLSAVTSLISYQRLHNIRVRWTPLTGISNVQYEVRHRGTSWETAQPLSTVATPYVEAPFSVDAETTVTIRVKPFVLLTSGRKHYGPETTVSHTQFPVISGYRVKSQAEHPGWSEVESAAAAAFLLHGPAAALTFTDGADVPVHATTANTVNTVSEATFHCNLTVSSSGTPEGLIFSHAGAPYPSNGGNLVTFDSSGNLILRVGTNEPILYLPTDQTSMYGQWNLYEISGNRLDSFGANDLTVVGDVTGIPVEGTTTQGTGAKFETGGSYLTGSGPALAGSDWTVCFQYDFYDSDSYEGAVLEIEGTLQVVFADDGDSIQIEIQHAGGGGETLLDFAPAGGSGVEPGIRSSGRVIIWYVESTKILSVMVANDDRDYDNTYGSWDEGSTVLPGSVVDRGLQTLYLGSRTPTFGQDEFEGILSNVMIFKRAPADFDERWELLHHIAPLGSPRLLIPAASVPKDTAMDLVWHVHKGSNNSASSITAWLNGVEYSEEDEYGTRIPAHRTSVSPSTYVSRNWTSPGTAKYNADNADAFEGELGANFNLDLNAYVTLNSDLSYWSDEEITAPLEVNVSDELTLTSTADYGQYEFDFDFAGLRKGRLWVEYTVASVADDVLLINDANDLIYEADYPITLDYPENTPYLSVFIQLDGTGEFLPFEEGTYEFTTSKFRIVLQRDPVDDTIPLLEDFTVYFHNDGDQVTLQTQTTNDTQTTLTTNGDAAAATNIIVLTDDNTLRFEGTLIARKSDNTERAKYFIEGIFERGTGAASVAEVTSQLTVLHEDDDDWDVEIAADTTNGGIAIKVTGVAATTINWIADIYVREFA
jgi:predicted phage tail protein